MWGRAQRVFLFFIFFVLFLPATINASRLISITTCGKIDEKAIKPIDIKDLFTQETTEIHVIAVVDGFKAGVKMKGTFISVDAVNPPNYKIDSLEKKIKKDGKERLHFSLSKPAKGWPAGKYKFTLHANGILIATAPFSVAPDSGEKPSSGFQLGPVQEDKNRAWTVVVYMDGDNNLEPFALKDLDEMERSLPKKGVDVIVLLDRSEEYSDEQGNWADARVFRIRSDREKGVKSEVLATPGELNMGDTAVLQAFLSAAMKTFPARRNALILWNHGGGWAAHVTDEKAPGAQQDFDKLTLPELNRAIAWTLKDLRRKKIDLVGFDMCLMAQLETAFELEGLADVMVGSEAVEPGDGWPYETLIPLFADDRLSTKEVGKGIVAAYDEYYKNRQETIATQSAFDLNLVGNVVDALNSFLAKVDGSLTRIWPSLTRTMYFSESYSDLGDMRRGSDALLSVDMANAIENLVGVVPELKSTPEYKAFRNALKNFVLDSRNSPRHRKSQGVSLYAPFRRDLFNKGYQETRFARKSRWPKTLGSLYAIQEKNPARPVIKGVETISLLRQKTVSEVIQLGQDGFAFEFDGKNLLWAFAYLGVRDEEKKQTLIFQKSILRKAPKEEELTIEKKGREEMLESYTHADGVHMVGFRYDGTRRVISNGEKAFVATTDESDVGDIEAHIITVPAIYEHPKVGKYFATIYFNWLWNAVGVTLEVPQRDGSYVYAHIDPQPDATIHLLLESLSDEGKKSYMVSGTLPWKNGLFLSVDLVPPDKYEVILALESLTGMSNMARHRFSVAARDDDLLKGVANAPEELLPENFFGEWEFLDAQSWFKEGRMESIGAFAKYEPHPRYKNLLKKTLYKPKGKPLFPGLDAVEVIQRQGLPHLRQYVFDEGGIPRADYGYRMSFPVFDFKDGQYFLLEMDLATGELGVMVKRTGPTPKLSIPQGQAPSTGGIQEGIPPEGSVPSVLAGVWQSADGSAVNFRGNQWSYYEGGQKADGGVFGIQGYRLFAKSQHSGEVTVYLFQVLGNQLLLQDPYGEIYQFFRTR